jgi:glucokinase
MTTPYAIGIDIGATHVKGVVVTTGGEILVKEQFATSNDGNAWAREAKRFVAAIEQSRGSAKWIGIAAPGLVARDHRSIGWMQGRLAAIQGFDWTVHLERESIVPLINDAHAALLAEMWRGAAVGISDAVLLTLGTGVGGAIASGGRLLRGHLGRAGHLGHLSLDPDGALDIVNTPGSLEDAIGNHTVAKRTDGRFGSTEALVAAYNAGDTDAAKAWLKSVKALAAGIASIINVVDPAIVILGGGIAGAGPALFHPLNQFLQKFEWRPHGSAVRVVPALLGEWAGAIGAARNAMMTEIEET